MTSVELADDDHEVWGFDEVRVFLGRATRPDGRPVSRSMIERMIRDDGLPAHRLTRGGRWYFYADEIRAFVGNRWNRRTPPHRSGRHHDGDG